MRCQLAKALQNAAPQVKDGEGRRVAPEGLPRDSKPSPVVAAPIKQAEDFIKRVGRPRVYADRKTQMRELMRRKRARTKAQEHR